MLISCTENPLFKRKIQLFLISLVICLIAKGVALFPFAQAVDSYPKLVAMSQNPAEAAGVFEEFVAQGRVGQWMLHKFLATLGIIGPGGNTFYVLLAMCCYVAAGIMLCRLWGIEDDMFLSICVVGIFAIHPYHAEPFIFREMAPTAGLAPLLAISGLVVADRFGRRWMLGLALLVISLSLYQIAINFTVIAMIVLCLTEWCQSNKPWMMRPCDQDVKRFAQVVGPRALAAVASVPAYFVFYKLSLGLVSGASGWHESQRSALLALTEAPERLISVLRTIKYVFISPEPLMPVLAKALIGVLLVLAVYCLTRKALRKPGVGRWLELAIAGALLLTASLAIVGILMTLATYFPVDRTLAAVSVLIAGLLAIVGVNAGPKKRGFTFALVFLLLLSFVGVNNVVLAEQFRVNSRDRATASRMIARLENDPGFPSVKKISVIGQLRQYPLRFYTAKPGSDVNVSGFTHQWSKANLLREVSGYRFADPTTADLDRATRYCRGARPWPHPESVVVLDDMAVVYLSKE